MTLENSNTQFVELFDSSNKFFGSLDITHFFHFRQKNSRHLESWYLEYIGRSNKIVDPLDDFLSFSWTLVLAFRPKSESSKGRTFYSDFLVKKYITKVFSFSSDVFLRKMAPVKWKLINKFLAKKYKALKDLENGLSNKDIATKYGVLLKTPYQQSHSLNCTARLSHLLHVWVILIFFAKFIRPGSIEDEDDGEDNDDDLNDNIDDLDCPSPLTWPSNRDTKEA